MKNIIRFMFGLTFLGVTSMAQAVVVEFTIDSNDNDCVGYYSEPKGGFDTCVIASEDTGEGISSVIAKWEMGKDGTSQWDTNEAFREFNSNLMSFTPENPDETQVGSWAYNAESSGIRYWVIKHGNGFTVYYDTDNADCAGANASTHACMTTANEVTSGSWDITSTGSSLSHITFYDSEIRVPEPGTLALFGLGLLGLAASSRRRRKI